MYNDVNIYFPYIACAEAQDPATWLQKCAPQFGINYQSLIDCSNNPYGNTWEHDMALQTEALIPPHHYVPWVTVYGAHSTEAEGDLLTTVCNAYQGVKPTICNKEGVQSPRSPCFA